MSQLLRPVAASAPRWPQTIYSYPEAPAAALCTRLHLCRCSADSLCGTTSASVSTTSQTVTPAQSARLTQRRELQGANKIILQILLRGAGRSRLCCELSNIDRKSTRLNSSHL